MTRVEDRGHCHLQPQGLFAEDQGHVLRLVVADAMFTRQCAADLYDALHEPFADRLHSFQLAWLA